MWMWKSTFFWSLDNTLMFTYKHFFLFLFLNQCSKWTRSNTKVFYHKLLYSACLLLNKYRALNVVFNWYLGKYFVQRKTGMIVPVSTTASTITGYIAPIYSTVILQGVRKVSWQYWTFDYSILCAAKWQRYVGNLLSSV